MPKRKMWTEKEREFYGEKFYALREEGVTLHNIATQYSVSESTVSLLVKNHIHKISLTPRELFYRLQQSKKRRTV